MPLPSLISRPFRSGFRAAFLFSLACLLPIRAFAQDAVPTVEAKPVPVKTIASAPETEYLSGAVRISILPSAFPHQYNTEYFFREVLVTNNLSTPLDVALFACFRSSFNDLKRTAAVKQQIPPNSRQIITVLAPVSNQSRYQDVSGTMEIYLNGKRQNNPLKLDNVGITPREASPHAATSFENHKTAYSYLMRDLIEDVSYRPYFFERNPVLSSIDTMQWPSAPQFYEGKSCIFRKTTDKITPEAERAIRNAVMLGMTEILVVPDGAAWPEGTGQKQNDGIEILRRGFGQTIILQEPPEQELKEIETLLEEIYSRNMSESAMRDAREKEIEKWINNLNAVSSALVKNYMEVSRNLGNSITSPAPQFITLPQADIPEIPIYWILLALLVFIILVGPVNYLYLLKRKKNVMLLLVTVPVISLIFVGVVVLFVSIREGWYARASAVGVTLLDQRENMAYTRAGVSLYAPFPPFEIVLDSSDSVLFSSAPDFTVAMGRNQVISGAAQPRIPLNYAISRAEKRLEQLKVSRGKNGSISVVNGLGFPVRIPALAEPDGTLWDSEDKVIPPGASTQLHKTGTKTKRHPDNPLIRDLSELNALFLLGASRVIDMPEPEKNLFSDLFEEYGGSRDTSWVDFNGNDNLNRNIRNKIEELHTSESGSAAACLLLPPGMYLAETDQPAFYSPGIQPASFRVKHAVIGTFTIAEESEP